MMKASRLPGRFAGILPAAALLIAAVATTAIAQSVRPVSPRNLVLWDTVSTLGEKLNPDDRSQWQAVPTDLLLLEKDPPKASSDPGYYGREYVFQGDAVVETPAFTAVFWSGKGCVAIYSKQESSTGDSTSEPAPWPGAKAVEVCPVLTGAGSVNFSHPQILRNAGDEIMLKISFSAPGSASCAGVFSFDKTGIVQVKPAENMRRVRLSAPMEYGVVPAFVGDDLIYGGLEHPGTNEVAVPSESLFLALLPGENRELIVTWPRARQQVSLQFNGENKIQSLELDNNAEPFYLAVLSAPGIWHKEALTADSLEKEVKFEWRRPFPARWKTQLFEEELKTTFAFRESRSDIWRGVAGSYTYPVWFSGEEAYYRLGKKIPPKGEAVIYSLEGRDTPLNVSSPADILKQTLGREAAEPILDFAGRKLRTHHRRGADGVRRACTCGCTEAIQAVFETAQETGKKDYIQGALDDMIFFVQCHVERINEYRRFADGLLKTVEQKRRSAPDLKPFLDGIEEIARQIPQECEVQKENMRNLGYAGELSKKTIALTSTNEPGNLKAYMELLKAWREMGGAQDYVVAKCHVLTRNLCLAAGYRCGSLPAAVSLAEQIRADSRKVLRNPDGYEIWADY